MEIFFLLEAQKDEKTIGTTSFFLFLFLFLIGGYVFLLFVIDPEVQRLDFDLAAAAAPFEGLVISFLFLVLLFCWSII